MNPLRKLQEAGQAPWLDYIHRGLLTEGGLTRLIEEDGVSGVTSNPSIFQQAIAAGTAYDEQIAEVLAAEPRAGAGDLYERLAVADIRTAADQLRGVWDATGGADGYVSLEVSPYLAHDTGGTIDEARRLWGAVDRPNLMIKVPGTAAGVPAFETLIGDGINVNVTLMFSLATYEAVAQAYLRGLARCSDPARVASVASFFVSRVDTAADAALERIGTGEALALRGRTAIANAKLAYRRFEQIFHGEPFAALAARGARPQRVLWASTSTKNPAYRDVIYVEELIGPETVNTLPPKTVEAFRDHGEVRQSLGEDVPGAEAHLERLAAVGVDLDAITDRLQSDGVEAFAASFDDLLAAVEGKRRQMVARRARRPSLHLGELRGAASAQLQRWQDERFSARLWARDVSLFAPAAAAAGEWPAEVADRLGWLALPESMVASAAELTAFAAEVSAEGTRDVVVLGMGGSSLAPEVFGHLFGTASTDGGGDGRPRLSVLDTTHPAAVRAALDRLDPAAALFVVSSKSGTTVETDSLFRAAWERTAAAVSEPGRRFVAITDPGSRLAKLAEERGFRRLFTAPPDVGGRYSALTPFGLVPAALAGADAGELLDRGFVMAQACSPAVPELENPGLALGAVIAAAAAAGRDKLTLLTSPALASFPDWIEQLVAESLGKDGRGVVPVVGEPLGAPEGYAEDRLFVAIRLEGDGDAALATGLAALAAAGHPVVEIALGDRYDLGAEMVRWELAVAAAGAAMGVQPFDQPDVELAKKLAREAMADESGGGAAGGSAAQERIDATDETAARAALEEWLAGTEPGGYLAIQAFLAPTAETAAALDALRRELAARSPAAVTAGWGPRFLHSTGQLHKGGPEGGRFLQLVDRPGDDLPVPGADFTFGRLIRAQAAGDAAALARRGRPVLHLDLGADPAAVLRGLAEALSSAPAPATA